MGASVPLAWLLYRFVETPGRIAPNFVNARPRKSLLTALAASAACVILAFGVNNYWQRALLFEGDEAATFVPIQDPIPTQFVPPNLSPSLRGVSGDKPVIYKDGCHLSATESQAKECVYGEATAPRVVLFGDSHAAQWFPSLLAWAEKAGMSLESHTKSSCAATLTPANLKGVSYRQCEEWRSEVLDRIVADPPELVVISNLANTDGQGSDEDLSQWEDGLAELLALIPTRVVVLADTPYFDFTPSVCLSGNLDDTLACAEPRSKVLFPNVQDAELLATKRHGVPYLDLNDFVCGAEVCAPILGDVLVYRDGHHMTATFSEMLAGPLGSELDLVMSREP